MQQVATIIRDKYGHFLIVNKQRREPVQIRSSHEKSDEIESGAAYRLYL